MDRDLPLMIDRKSDNERHPGKSCGDKRQPPNNVHEFQICIIGT